MGLARESAERGTKVVADHESASHALLLEFAVEREGKGNVSFAKLIKSYKGDAAARTLNRGNASQE